MDYHAYLLSPEWREKRKQVWRRARGCCEQCGAEGRDVHHENYDRLGDENLDDLELLCGLCHGYAHGKTIDDLIDEAVVEFFTKFPSGRC